MRGLTSSQSARGTIRVLTSSLEQARTASILSGTNAYLGFPDTSTSTITNTYQLRSFCLFRHRVDQNGDNADDFVPGATGAFVLLSKWERLPGDLQFSPASLALLDSLNPDGVAFPGRTAASSLRVLGFEPSGGLINKVNTRALLFASSNKVTNSRASVADRIEISPYSGRVRYTGLTNDVAF